MDKELIYAAQLSPLAFTKLTYPQYQIKWFHKRISDALYRVATGSLDRLMIFMPPRHGKALAVDTPIPTPDGWTTMGELRPGDRVFDENGVPCNVVAVSPVWKDRPVYVVTTDDRDEIIADAAHEWRVRMCGKREVYHIHTTERIAQPRAKRPTIRRQGALQLPDAGLPIDPYVFGVWLGDGNSGDGAITEGLQDIDFIRAQIEQAGYRTTTRSADDNFGIRGMRVTLRDMGVLHNKHIPTAYLRASEAQRLALLQGLVDTDGYVARDGQVEVCGIGETMMRQVQELVHSLGRKAALYEGAATIDGRYICQKYRVSFYMADAARLPRKRERCREGVRTPNRYIDARPAGTADTVCIQVDSPSHMFLCGRSMLPTHNSELVSVRFPAWYLGRNPDKRFMHASYNVDLAEDFGRKARNLIGLPEYQAIFPGVRVASDSSSATRFDISGRRGGYYAAGVGGPLTGRGADILNIDDPFKNRQDAESEAIRETVWDWYSSTALTRLEGRGAVILTMTRWHEDDLAGRLLDRMEKGGEQWHIISLPAISDDGVALWEEKFPLEVLLPYKQEHPRDWEALYQQRPAPLEGGIFQRAWWQYYKPDALPRITRVEHCVDSSFKTGVSNDYSVIATWGRGADTRYYLLDLRRGKWEMPELLLNIHRHYRKHQKTWPGAVVTIEDRASGQSAIQMLMRPLPQMHGAALPPLPVVKFKIPNGASKVSRAEAVSGLVEGGHVVLPERPEWQGCDLETFLREHSSFPNAAHDDCVDTTSMGLLRLSKMRGEEDYTAYMPVVTPRGEVMRRRW